MGKDRPRGNQQTTPALTGRLVISTSRGQLRAQAWPKPRGKSQPRQSRQWVERFVQAQKDIRRIAPSQMLAAIEATKHGSLYPRDVLLKAGTVGLMDITTALGGTVHHQTPFVDAMVFNGAFSRLATNKTFGTGSFITITWPLPVLDTAAFWSAAQPARFTVPEFIEVVRVSAGLVAVNTSTDRYGVRILDQASNQLARQLISASGVKGLSITTGPLAVNQGDFFTVQAFQDSAQQLAALGTWFAIEVLQATTP